MELSIRKQMGGILTLVMLFSLFATTAIAQPGGKGRLSPASLDLDACGCPTTFGDPYCETHTEWTLDKVANNGEIIDPDNTSYSFTVTVTEGPTVDLIKGTGQIVITNSGGQPTYLSSIALTLEDVHTGPGKGDGLGPSGKNWDVLAFAVENEAAACDALNIANTTYGEVSQTTWPNAGIGELVLYDAESNDVIALNESLIIPVAIDNDGDGKSGEDPALEDLQDQNCWGIIDNDGDGQLDEDPGFGAEVGIDNDEDGLIDEDPVDGIDNDGDLLVDEDDPDDDGDGLVDEDGPDDDRDGLIDEDNNCGEDEVVRINFEYTFDASLLPDRNPGDGIVPSDDDLRINLMATFESGGKRGGTKDIDVDCDGTPEEDVRTIQQRHRFDPPDCNPVCQSVTLVDNGATVSDECYTLTTETLNETIAATGVEGTTHTFTIEGTISGNGEQAFNAFALEQQLDPYNNTSGEGGSATLSVTYPVSGGSAYFPHAYITNAGDFDGDYLGWCVDTDNTIGQNTNYCVELISTYSEAATSLVEHPENLDLVNWIINQDFTTQAATCVARNYTYGDIQRAIWRLIEDNLSTSGLGTWNECAATEIINAAQASGDGFEPPCDGQVAVIANPCGNTQSGTAAAFQITIFQITMAEFPVLCTAVCNCDPALVTNTATLGGAGCEGFIEGSPASASFAVSCTGEPPPIEPGDFCSQTQGGWGSGAAGKNTGTLRDTYFATVFPSGLIVGDPDGPDGDGSFAILLTSSAAVEAYLPAGGTPAALTADQTDPQTTSSGVFGGQLVAATLNVAFDAAGIGKCTLTGTCTFPHDPGTLGTLIYGDCVVTGLQGLSVNEVIALANTAISGGGLPAGVSFSDLSDALALLNEEFVDCEAVATGCLVLPQSYQPSAPKTGGPAIEPEVVIPDDYALAQNYPNPFNPSTTFSFDLPQDSKVKLTIYNMVGQEVATVVKGSFSAGRHTINWQAPSDMASGMYLYRLQAGRFVDTKKMLFLK